jgi:hypothetical protein
MIEISNCLVDTTKYEQVTQMAQPRKHAHFCIRPYRGFSTSCIGAWPGGVPGIVFTRPWKWSEKWGKGGLEVNMKWVHRTSFSNMHLLSTRSGFLQGAYSCSTVCFQSQKDGLRFELDLKDGPGYAFLGSSNAPRTAVDSFRASY